MHESVLGKQSRGDLKEISDMHCDTGRHDASARLCIGWPSERHQRAMRYLRRGAEIGATCSCCFSSCEDESRLTSALYRVIAPLKWSWKIVSKSLSEVALCSELMASISKAVFTRRRWVRCNRCGPLQLSRPFRLLQA